MEAANAAEAPKAEPESKRRVSVTPPAPVAQPHPEPVETQRTQAPAAEPPLSAANGNEALSLLQKAHDQLATRKDSIENELARVETLKNEHASIIAQLAAIDQAMSVFRRPE